MSFLSSPSRTRGRPLPPLHREISSQPPPAAVAVQACPFPAARHRPRSFLLQCEPGADYGSCTQGGGQTLFATPYWLLWSSILSLSMVRLPRWPRPDSPLFSR